jgi:hypothetical protein
MMAPRKQLNDSSLEKIRKEARTELLTFLSRRTEDKKVAAQSAAQIHGMVCAYERSRRRVTVRTQGGKLIREWQCLSSPLAAVEHLERLARVATGYKLTKAWAELPPIAMDALSTAAQRVTGKPLSKMMLRWPINLNFLTVPKWADIMPLLPTAIEVARTFGRKEIERDRAVIAILRGYYQIFGKPPTAKPAEAFIAGVEGCYRDLLPGSGLNVASSKKTLQRLINAAK